jgi:1,4-alpha-glucan branching enzyme
MGTEETGLLRAATEEVNMAKNARTGAKGKSTQSFSFAAPTAMSVQLVGDFTHWKNEPINMKKGPDGVWHASVTLSPGDHHYRFLVDGQWRDDPECTLHVPNPYGGQDSVRRVN